MVAVDDDRKRAAVPPLQPVNSEDKPLYPGQATRPDPSGAGTRTTRAKDETL